MAKTPLLGISRHHPKGAHMRMFLCYCLFDILWVSVFACVQKVTRVTHTHTETEKRERGKKAATKNDKQSP